MTIIRPLRWQAAAIRAENRETWLRIEIARTESEAARLMNHAMTLRQELERLERTSRG